MATSKTTKKVAKAKETSEETLKPVVKQEKKDSKTLAKKPETKKNKPSFKPKELLILDGKECVFVEKLRGEVIVRFLEGGYASAEESKFTSK